MNLEEHDVVIATLTGACLKWTDQRYTDTSAPQWVTHLIPLDFETAMASVMLIVDRKSEFPTVAELMEVYRGEKRRRSMQLLGLPEPEIPMDTKLAGLAKARAALAAVAPPASPPAPANGSTTVVDSATVEP